MTAEPQGLERLLALEDIRLLRAKYCQYLDHHEFGSLVDVLSEDFVLDLTPLTKVLGGNHPGPISGRDAVIGYVSERMAAAKKLVHIATVPIIEFQDGEHATAILRLETFVKEGRPDGPGNTGIAYLGVRDTYRKDNGEWRMTSVWEEVDVLI